MSYRFGNLFFKTPDDVREAHACIKKYGYLPHDFLMRTSPVGLDEPLELPEKIAKRFESPEKIAKRFERAQRELAAACISAKWVDQLLRSAGSLGVRKAYQSHNQVRLVQPWGRSESFMAGGLIFDDEEPALAEEGPHYMRHAREVMSCLSDDPVVW